MDERLIALLKVLRECCILMVTALDTFLGYERTIPTREERRKMKENFNRQIMG